MISSYLSVVDHSAEELQLQVQPTGNVVEEQPQAAGEVLENRSEPEIETLC